LRKEKTKKMKLHKLNPHGIVHHILPLLVVVMCAIIGVGYLVASHADSVGCSGGMNSTVLNGQCESLVGRVSVPSKQETVTAYACVTKISSSYWRTTALFRLSNTYTMANPNWTAAVLNTGTTPLANNKLVETLFNDTAPQPSAVLTIFSNPQGENPLSFKYIQQGNATNTAATKTAAPAPIQGYIAQNIHPASLDVCGTPQKPVSAPTNSGGSGNPTGPTSTPATPSGTIYRFWNGKNHFYTANPAEASSVQQGGWHLEETYPFYYSQGTGSLKPVYRAYSPGSGDHLYTTNWNEIVSAETGAGYQYEGVAFYTYPTLPAPANYDGVAWIREYNPSTGDHFYEPCNEYNSGGGQPASGYEIENYAAFYTFVPAPGAVPGSTSNVFCSGVVTNPSIPDAPF
jgi:hypothetical protein